MNVRNHYNGQDKAKVDDVTMATKRKRSNGQDTRSIEDNRRVTMK